MELELFKDLQVKSIETTIKTAVAGMDPIHRLKMVMETVGMALDAGERFNEFITEAWELVAREHWWKPAYKSFEAFKTGCGLADSVTESIEAKKKTEKTKATLQASTVKAWSGESLKQILGDELMPANPSRGFLETLRTLAQQINDSTVAKALLIEARAERLNKAGSIKDAILQLRDLNAVLERVKNGNLRHRATIQSTKRTSSRIQTLRLEATESDQSSDDGTDKIESKGNFRYRTRREKE